MKVASHDLLVAARDAGLFRVSDPGISLWHAAREAGAPMPITAGMRVLDLGCCECDWLKLASQAWPETAFVGLDYRATTRAGNHVELVKGNAMDPAIFGPAQFDAIVSLSAIEHMGLGHYRDPVDPDGDSKVIANCWTWLKPGGWLYFDVPYDPTGYRVQDTKCRIYDDAAISSRLAYSWPADDLGAAFLWRGYSTAKDAGRLVPKPTSPATPFHYAASVWVKPNAKV